MDTERAIRRITHKASLVKVKRQRSGVRLKVSATAIWSAAASEARRRFGLCLCRFHLKTRLSSQSGVALRLPPHSIKSQSMTVASSFLLLLLTACEHVQPQFADVPMTRGTEPSPPTA